MVVWRSPQGDGLSSLIPLFSQEDIGHAIVGRRAKAGAVVHQIVFGDERRERVEEAH